MCFYILNLSTSCTQLWRKWNIMFLHLLDWQNKVTHPLKILLGEPQKHVSTYKKGRAFHSCSSTPLSVVQSSVQTSNLCCIKVRFYGTVLVLILNVVTMSWLLKDCINKKCNVVCLILCICIFNWAPRKNTLCNCPPPRINKF